ncbi:hypothetical protein HQ560_19300, partial [bacterium]|nr:hypothetical protein [bacterium]
MKKLNLALGLALCAAGCAPKQDAPRDIRALRRQQKKSTIVLPVWTLDVAEEIATSPDDYTGRLLVIDRAYLDPAQDVLLQKGIARFALRGGGMLVMPTERVPSWLRHWTGAPIQFRASIHPPRQNPDEGGSPGPVLRGESVDLAHPLELTDVSVERTGDDVWLTLAVENHRAEPGAARLRVQFGGIRKTFRVGPVQPGKTKTERMLLFGAPEPRWREFRPARRRLTVDFPDGTGYTLDLGNWLDDPVEALTNLGYSFTPPGTALLLLSKAGPEGDLERFAALELRSYLDMITDANVEPIEPDVAELAPELPLLLVGTAANNPRVARLIEAAGLADRIRDTGPEGYLLKTLDHEGRAVLLVTSQTARGVVHGVYGLIEHFGVRISFYGTRMPKKRPFKLPTLDVVEKPVFAVRRVVATGPTPTWTARWSQWQWISMIDQAAKNRFNQVVMPLDGLEATFTFEPGASRFATFPYEVGAYTCVAEARHAHGHGLAVLADYARQRGVDLLFARRSPEGPLVFASPPRGIQAGPARLVGTPVQALAHPADFLGLVRIRSAATQAAELLAAKSTVLSLPYRRGARSRLSFFAKFAWDTTLTPEQQARAWADTLTRGKDAERMAKAVLELDVLSDDVLVHAPRPFGQGPPLAFPVLEADLACDWPALKARAIQASLSPLAEQSAKLRDHRTQLEPIQNGIRDALGSQAPPWKDPLFEAVSTTRRADRIAQGLFQFRALLGALASVQEGALSYQAALAKPEDALPKFKVAAERYATAGRVFHWLVSKVGDSDLRPTYADLAGRCDGQADRLTRWLGPAAEAEPEIKLGVQGTDAIVHRFRTKRKDIYAAYLPQGRKVVSLRLPTEEVRVIRIGQPPKTVRAEGGTFLFDLDT